MKILKNKFGLILSEALLAIAMLSIGSLIVGTIINNAISTTTLSKNYLIAQNLATEAVEAVKSIRDTNWLLYSDDKSCWLSTAAECDTKVADEGNYIAKKDNNRWKLENKPGELDLTTNENYLLYINILYPGDDENEYNTYVHDNVGPKSIFYRGIHFTEIVDEAPAGVEDYATFEVTVEWKEGAKVRSLKRSVTLYNDVE